MIATEKEHADKRSGDYHASPEPAVPYGIMIDGAIYPLEGQPPVATSGGWLKTSGDS